MLSQSTGKLRAALGQDLRLFGKAGNVSRQGTSLSRHYNWEFKIPAAFSIIELFIYIKQIPAADFLSLWLFCERMGKVGFFDILMGSKHLSLLCHGNNSKRKT